MKDLSKKEKVQISLLALSAVIVVFGILFLLTAAKIAPIFKCFYNIRNILGQYIIVILTMSCGIMLFSNVVLTIENQKLRDGLTIGITTFAFVLTLPLVYVFIAIFPANVGVVGPIGGGVLMIGDIVSGFHAWFGNGAFVYVVYAFMLILSLVFLAVPVVSGALAVRGKTLKLGKQPDGKKGLIGVIELPVITKSKAKEEE